MESDQFAQIDRELNEARQAYRNEVTDTARLEHMAEMLPPGHPDGTQGRAPRESAPAGGIDRAIKKR